MAESFNAQFVSVFTAEDTSYIPVPEKVFTGKVEEGLVDLEFSVETVRTRLAWLREDKSPGLDDLSPKLLKELCEEIAYPVTQIFNRSLKEGEVPVD